MGDMIRCGRCGSHHYRNDHCPDDERKNMSIDFDQLTEPIQQSTAIARFNQNTAVAAYSKFNDQILSVESYAELKVAVDGIAKVEEAHKAVKRLSAEIEKTRVVLKDPSLEYGRTVDSIAKQLKTKVDAIEVRLASERKVYEAAALAEKKKKETERMAVIQLRIDHCHSISIVFCLDDLQAMTDDDFAWWFSCREKESIERKARIAEEAKIAAEFAEQQQKDREEQAAKMQADLEESQRQKAEELRIRAEELEAQRKADEIVRMQRQAELDLREERAKELLEQQRAEQQAMFDEQEVERKAAALVREQEIEEQRKAAQVIAEKEKAENIAIHKKLEADRQALLKEREELQRQKYAAEVAEELKQREHVRQVQEREAEMAAQDMAAEIKRREEQAAPELEKMARVMTDAKQVMADCLKDLGVPWWSTELLNRFHDLGNDMIDFIHDGESN